MLESAGSTSLENEVMKTAFVVGMLTLSVTVAGAHNKEAPGSETMMRSNATGGVGPGAASQRLEGPGTQLRMTRTII
jgi:hypothetical protein